MGRGLECMIVAGMLVAGGGAAAARPNVLFIFSDDQRHDALGAVNPRDLYYVAEFTRLAQQHDWFEFIPALSGDEVGDLPYERGLITDVVDRSCQSLSEHEGYLCGSPGMIDACIRVLTGNGMPEAQVFYDKFS